VLRPEPPKTFARKESPRTGCWADVTADRARFFQGNVQRRKFSGVQDDHFVKSLMTLGGYDQDTGQDREDLMS
jgi:hypothetical protein